MIMTVSTVKDSLPNVQRFVEGNLDGGVDHMIVFLDAPAPRVLTWLEDRPEVTAVVTPREWWGDKRPALLNRRQNMNANLTRHVLAEGGWADWLFHVDADEVLRLDRDEIDRVPRKVTAIGVRPLEVASVPDPEGLPVLFKRLLTDDELELVTALGLLTEKTNSRYFRSHIAGKVGVRPSAKVVMGIHKATDLKGRRLPLTYPEGCELLHYEAFSRDEFVRKWIAMVGSGPRVNFGPHRLGLATALRTLLDLDISEESRAHHLTQFYLHHMADPVDDLDSLGLLERRTAAAHGHIPSPVPAGVRVELRTALNAWHGRDKRRFIPPPSPENK